MLLLVRVRSCEMRMSKIVLKAAVFPKIKRPENSKRPIPSAAVLSNPICSREPNSGILKGAFLPRSRYGVQLQHRRTPVRLKARCRLMCIQPQKKRERLHIIFCDVAEDPSWTVFRSSVH
ncbi:hypothetical protein QE152_g29733 [Popillia japonica]|uniref:Uncharacterized protein n=1 Tax=Popillia japonica TaxID=7064 RepID=A0AAW1JGT7_POPJA